VRLAIILALKGGIGAKFESVVAVGTSEARFVEELFLCRKLVCKIHRLAAYLAGIHSRPTYYYTS